jgi:uncharacterized membrane protein
MCGCSVNGAYGTYYNGFGNIGYYGGNGLYRNSLFGFMYNGFELLLVIAVLSLIVIAIFMFVRKSWRNKPENNNSILEALKMKYIQGEITKEEFLERRNLLNL